MTSGGGCLGADMWQQSVADAGVVADPTLAKIFHDVFSGKTASEVQEMLKDAQPPSYED